MKILGGNNILVVEILPNYTNQLQTLELGDNELLKDQTISWLVLTKSSEENI